jgi:hypothetical protein
MGNNKSLILDVRFIVGGTNARLWAELLLGMARKILQIQNHNMLEPGRSMQIYPRLLGEFYTCMMKIWLFETLCAMNSLFDKDATPHSSKETQDPANKG